MTLTRRHVMIGAAATVAAAALPAAAVAAGEPAVVGYSALDIEALDFPDTPAWAEAVRSAWIGSGGELTTFADMFPHLQAILEEEIMTGIDAAQVQTDRPYVLADITEVE
jgi:hypothetical protein